MKRTKRPDKTPRSVRTLPKRRRPAAKRKPRVPPTRPKRTPATIAYNSQRNNYSFENTFRASWQCFSTVAWMFLSYYDSKLDGADDVALARYLDDVEATIGTPGLGERVKQRYRWITGRTSLWWLTHQTAIQEHLSSIGKARALIFRENNGTWAEVSAALQSGPVILGTSKLPGLSGGHIVLVIGETADAWQIHDPYGDARTDYKEPDGRAREYNKAWLRAYTENVTGRAGMIRILY